MSRASNTYIDLRDRRDSTVEEDDEALRGAEAWPDLSATSRLLSRYEEGRRERSDDPQIHLRFGRDALAQRGLEDEAVASLTRYTELKPEDPEGHYQLGQAYMHKGAPQGAAAAFERALGIHPDDADVLVALHLTYFTLLRFEDAVRCIEQVERIVGRQKDAQLDVRLFGVFKGIDLLLAGSTGGVRELLSPCVGVDGALGEATHFGLALLAVLEKDAPGAAEHRGYLERANSPLLPALDAARAREQIDRREAVRALTGRLQTT
jgi:tetratricopeptide (TPR) repeat protein